MPLSAKEILKNIDAGNIFVDPFFPENVKGASVDVRLGRYYFTQRENEPERKDMRWTLRNPWMRLAMNQVWRGVHEAFGACNLSQVLNNWFHFPIYGKGSLFTNNDLLRANELCENDELIVIPQHEMILSHTEEFVGSNASFVGDLRGRSSVYRSALTVSSDGNWGDPAFFGRWSLKIENQTDDIVILPVGRRIAQIVFHEVRDGETYVKENGGGKYQATEDRERIKREWKPEMILPRLHLDREVVQAPMEIL